MYPNPDSNIRQVRTGFSFSQALKVFFGMIPLLGLTMLTATSVSWSEDTEDEELDFSKLIPAADKKVDFEKEIYPLFKEFCIDCHGPKKKKGRYRIDTKEGKDGAFKIDRDGVAFIKPGDSKNSRLTHMMCDMIDEMLMPPPEADPLSKEQIGLIRAWIDQGAKWPDGPIKEYVKQIDFKKDIQPILAKNCYSCHGPEKQDGDYRIDKKETALEGPLYGTLIKPGNSERSALAIIAAGLDEDLLFPEKHKLPEKDLEIFKLWIDQGAKWEE
jgi:mono/diheme cytochrome c family protein